MRVIDKTETVENARTTANWESAAPHRMDIERSELEEIRTIDDYLLEVHGIQPGKKREGITRLLYENRNGLNSILSGNENLKKARQVIDDLEADVVAYNEHQQNLYHKQNVNGF